MHSSSPKKRQKRHKELYNRYFFLRILPRRVFLYGFIWLWRFSRSLFGKAPPRRIPLEMEKAFTLNGKIPVVNKYYDGTYPYWIPRTFRKKDIDILISAVKKHYWFSYARTNDWLFRALKKHPIKGKDCAVLGSTTPWFESFCIVHKGKPTTIEYNKLNYHHKKMHTLTVKEFEENPRKFDVAISISSFEHDGIGRYGDPLDPEGDFKAMKKARKLLKKGGLLFLGIPVGKDRIIWNANRVYGHLRLPLLLKGWKVLDSFGFNKSLFDSESYVEPIFVLKKY